MGVDQGTFTFDHDDHLTVLDFAQDAFPALCWTEKQGRHFYSHLAKPHEGGCSVLWGHNNSPRSVCLEINGSGLRNRTHDETLSLLHGIKSLGGKATRIDIRADLHGTGTLYSDDALDSCQLQHCNLVWKPEQAYDPDSTGKGLTVYLGAKSSDRIWRVYDKSAEQGIGIGSWYRVEVQLRRRFAQASFDSLLCSDDQNAAMLGMIFSDKVWSVEPEWWTWYRDNGAPFAVPAEPYEPEIERFLGFISRVVGGSVAAAAADANCTPLQLWNRLGKQIQFHAPARIDPRRGDLIQQLSRI